MEYIIYFDESGDLGWRLDKPYRKEGSSRYFTIAYLLIPVQKIKLISRFNKRFHKARGGKSKEIKGAKIKSSRAKTLCRRIVNEILNKNPDISIGAVTVDKRSCPSPVVNTKNDNVLYDFMVKRGIADKIISLSKVTIVPDKRSVPTGSMNSCSDLLKSDLWLEKRSNVDIKYTPEESHTIAGLMFIDWIANFIWRNYEDNVTEPYTQLEPYIEEELLF